MAYQLRGKTFDQFSVGDEFHTASRTITEADVATFAGLSGDYNPLHTDQVFMEKSAFGGRIAHGALILSVATGLANQLGIFEGTSIAVLEMVTRFTAAVKFGDTVRVLLTINDKKESKKPDRGVINVGVKVFNQTDQSVLEGNWMVMLARG